MAEIIWTSPALDDLNDLAEYIALSNNKLDFHRKKMHILHKFIEDAGTV